MTLLKKNFPVALFLFFGKFVLLHDLSIKKKTKTTTTKQTLSGCFLCAVARQEIFISSPFEPSCSDFTKVSSLRNVNDKEKHLFLLF
jgi:hypothetical protein